MNSSPEVKDLLTALSKFQSVIEGVPKTSANDYFKSRYADLASVWETIREPLTKNGLSVTQLPGVTSNGASALVTVLGHTSGQWVESQLILNPVKNDPQSMGSAITYARRYALMAIVGIAPEDDDGEAAQGRPVANQNHSAPPVAKTPAKPAQAKPPGPAEIPNITNYTVPFGKFKGAMLKGIPVNELVSYRDYLQDGMDKNQREGKKSSADTIQFVILANQYLDTLESDDDIPF